MARVTLAVGVVLAMALLVACRDDPEAVSTTDDPRVAELASQRAQWEATRPNVYRFTVEAQCFCPVSLAQPRTVTVDGEDVVAEEPAPTDEVADRVMTVDDLFDRAGAAIEEADDVQIEYDERFNFPTRVAVDAIAEAVDDEVTYVVTRFEALDG